MFRSFYVVYEDSCGGSHRVDSAEFAACFRLYQSHRTARLFGVDRLDRSCLMGERCCA
jgi:hypothetical protein